MRFEMMTAWPVGQWLIPAGTVIDGNDPNWNGIPLPLPMPLSARALDQSAADALAHWYPFHFHLLHCANGIKPKRSVNV
jgi:hypothetical protein